MDIYIWIKSNVFYPNCYIIEFNLFLSSYYKIDFKEMFFAQLLCDRI